MKLNKLMAAAIVLSFSSMITTTVYAGKVHLRNCMNEDANVQTYSKGDSSQAIAASSKTIFADDKATLSCDTNKCRVVINNKYEGTYDHHHLICHGGNISDKVSEDDMVCANTDTAC